DLELEADKYCDDGDLLFAWSASFGPFIWSGGRVIFHYHIWKLDVFSHDDLNKRFLYTWLLGKTQEIKASGHGISMAHMTKERFELLDVALPPFEEQTRIVAKVDELMALCDQLEQQQQDRRTLQNALRQSTMQALAGAQSPHELQTNWRSLQANFGWLFSEPRDVAELRSLLVELAIRGVLSPAGIQEAETNPAQPVVLQADQRAGRRFAKVTHVDPPFDLPATWTWALFDELLDGSDSGWSPKCDAEPRRPGEWGVLKVSAVTWGEFRAEENKRLPPSLDSRPECEVKAGDFLLSRANTADLVARSVIAPLDVQDRLLMSDKIVRLSFIDSELKPWANLVNNSQFAREYYRSNATGTSDSMRNVSRQVIHELPIPLPPKLVQTAVMQRLAELNQLCDSLESELTDKALYSARLSEAATAALTGINIKQDEDTVVKAPQTELIAPLRLATPPGIKAQAPLATLLVRHQGEMAARDLWQRFGGEIDAFYAQLKTEVAHGWIAEPDVAEVREKAAIAAVKA
ncbi:MAG: restriction endonuclease subunit S, partial [Comamonadaceae bacterium]|nr:restriction endonuclease subunit S [Comamonadaceae bacterium]